jgi:hypothetical protein
MKSNKGILKKQIVPHPKKAAAPTKHATEKSPSKSLKININKKTGI